MLVPFSSCAALATMSLLLSYSSPPSLLHNHRLAILRRPRRADYPAPPSWICPSPDARGIRLSLSFVSRAEPMAGASDLARDAGAAAAVLVGAYGLVHTFDNLAQRNLIKQSLSRKLVHILSGLLFMLSWPIFSTSIHSRYFASLVPLVNCSRLVVHGLELVSDEGLIKSMTREGKPEELLKGPLYYVLVLIVCALFFWRESPVGVISLSMMCAGDGIADIMGRNFGSIKIPYNQRKSWVGSVSMFIFGFLVSIMMLFYYSFLGYFHLDWPVTLQRVALVSLAATVVESLPISDFVDDNISVPLASIVVSYLSFNS